jgi:RHS repeat-associated protein
VQVVDHRANTTVDYGYDALNRLASAGATGAGTSDYSYAYDNASNRSSMTRDGQSTSYAYDSGNKLCWKADGDHSAGCQNPPSGATTYDYDSNGNLRSSSDGLQIAYNALNQSTSVDPAGSQDAVSFGYFGEGNAPARAARATPTPSSASPSSSARTRPCATPAMTAASWSACAPAPDATIRSPTSSARSSRSPTPTAPSPTATATATPYGAEVETTTPAGTALDNPIRFAAGYLDTETNLYKFGERYYQPSWAAGLNATPSTKPSARERPTATPTPHAIR